MRRIIWTDEAVANLEAIAAYVHVFNPAAAARLASRLIEAAESLAEFSERGRRSQGKTRELPVVRPYIIRYRVADSDVIILRIRHSARKPGD